MSATASAQPRVAIVTGAARGIGAAIARRLAADGFDIGVLDLAAESCADTVAAIAALGRRACAVGADVSDEGAVAAAVQRVADALGAPTVLVNNAGIYLERAVHRMTLAEWDLLQNVNLRGAFLMSRALQPFIRAAGHGRIVNIASTAALGQAGIAGYSAAKAGLIGFTRSLALELGRYKATVNAVAPGFVVTDLTRASAVRLGVTVEQFEQQALQLIAVGRVGMPDDIANAVAFFVDERSGFVTGQVLYVAGAPRG